MTPPGARPRREPSFLEFVVIVALMMAMSSFSIDNILPAFDPIQRSFGVPGANELQLIVYVYMLGFGIMQIVYGPISDVVGRRPALLVGLFIYAAGCVLAIVASSFEVLLIARAIQGMGAAAGRVLAVAIIRDRYQGREMARVMSFTMMVFILVPIFAPAIGSFILLFGNWHLIFAAMLGLTVIVLVWFTARMPETLRPEYRFPFSFGRIAQGLRLTIGTRASIGYATAQAVMMGCLMAYIGSAQQIFEDDVYKLGAMFPVAFGLIAAVMGVASLVNSRLVRRLGMRRLSHAGILGYVVAALLLLLASIAFDGRPPLLLFGVLIACNQFAFSLTMPNFNAMAMEPLGKVAGTASSFIGFYTTLVGALLGMIAGQAFDGTVIPLSLAYFVFSTLCLAVVLWTERGRLFRPQHADPVRTAGQPARA
jgi:DHA1 family bicyclomycin/chloramphenicol resistance-like MFS transporter